MVKKKYLSLVLTFLLCISMIPTVSFGVSKPSKVAVTSATVDEYDNVTVTWNKVKCDGYKVEGGWYFHDDSAEPDYYEPKTSKNVAKSKTTCTIKAKRSDWADYVVRVRAFNKYKQKQYYNTKTHYWTTKKPSKKNWKGRKTRKKTAYKYGSYEWVEPTFEMSKDDIDIDSLDSPEGLSKELQIKWYAIHIAEKAYGMLRNVASARASNSTDNEYVKFYEYISSTPDFKNLSNAMKIKSICSSGLFSAGAKTAAVGNWKVNPGNAGASFEYSQLQLLKKLWDGTAKGQCGDMAKYSIALFKGLGLNAWYVLSNDGNHAWSVIEGTNSQGTKIYMKCDNGGITFFGYTFTPGRGAYPTGSNGDGYTWSILF